MQLLTRHQLLTLEEPELRGLAARMEAGLDERRAKRGLPPLTAEQRRFVRREAMTTAPRRGQR